jgi:hypothetical protein
MLLLGIGAIVLFFIQKDNVQQVERGIEGEETEQVEREPTGPTEFVYEPKPTGLPLVPAPYGSFKKYTSPDGNYIAWSYSNEGGESGIYITDLGENKLTSIYCGFFRSWSKDSRQIEVYVPVECNLPSGVNSASFYLTIEGDVLVDENKNTYE